MDQTINDAFVGVDLIDELLLRIQHLDQDRQECERLHEKIGVLERKITKLEVQLHYSCVERREMTSWNRDLQDQNDMLQEMHVRDGREIGTLKLTLASTKARQNQAQPN
jgi:hypothetical protein